MAYGLLSPKTAMATSSPVVCTCRPSAVGMAAASAAHAMNPMATTHVATAGEYAQFVEVQVEFESKFRNPEIT
jgi:hypothetical protein